jgi:hypothetical protein
MNKDIPAAIFRADEPEAFIGIVPLYDPCHLHTGREINGLPMASGMPGPFAQPFLPRGRGSRCALVDGQHTLDLTAFLPAPDLYLHCRPRISSLKAGRLENIGMEKSVAGPVGQFDESKAFLGIVPLDRSRNFRR